MTSKTPYERAELLLRETNEELESLESLHPKDPEVETTIQHLIARRYEIRNIMTFAGEPEFQEEADVRIKVLEEHPLASGLHFQHIPKKKT